MATLAIRLEPRDRGIGPQRGPVVRSRHERLDQGLAVRSERTVQLHPMRIAGTGRMKDESTHHPDHPSVLDDAEMQGIRLIVQQVDSGHTGPMRAHVGRPQHTDIVHETLQSSMESRSSPYHLSRNRNPAIADRLAQTTNIG